MSAFSNHEEETLNFYIEKSREPRNFFFKSVREIRQRHIRHHANNLSWPILVTRDLPLLTSLPFFRSKKIFNILKFYSSALEKHHLIRYTRSSNRDEEESYEASGNFASCRNDGQPLLRAVREVHRRQVYSHRRLHNAAHETQQKCRTEDVG